MPRQVCSAEPSFGAAWVVGPVLAVLAACAAGDAAREPITPALGTPQEVALRTGERSVDVLASGEPFATVRFGDEEGPCVFPLFARGGLAVTRGFPLAPGPDDAQDHPHHRSFWFAHGDVDGVDFWHDGGHIETLGFEVALRTGGNAMVELSLLWRANDGREILRERRTLTFHAEEGLRWVDARHELLPAGDGVVFGDTKEGTFALRIAPTLRVEGPVAAGTLRDADGRSGKDVWGKRSTWIAATGPVRDAAGTERQLSVVLLDHPQNLRYPTWWHARTYGLLAANPFGQGTFEGKHLDNDGALPLSRGEKLVLRYRVLLGDGPLPPERIEAEAQRFSGAPDETLI
jgi:hypothetical protein